MRNGRTTALAVTVTALLVACTGGGADEAPDETTPSPSATPSSLEVDQRTLGQGEDEDTGTDELAELEDEGIEVDEGEDGPTGPFDVEAFCAAAGPVDAVATREGIGSDEHVAALDAVVEVAPAELYDDLVQLRDHYDLAVDPADPPSQALENFPSHIQAAVARVEGGIEERC